MAGDLSKQDLIDFEEEIKELFLQKINKQEEWRPIIGYGGLYDVSNCGRVRPVIPRCRTSTILHPDLSGYPRVTLTSNGSHKRYMVHRLVTAAFLGPLPSGYQVHHLDRNPRNNTISNLVYIPMAENLGLPHRGKGQKKLSGKPIGCLAVPAFEEWRPVVRYEGLYEVSSESNVKLGKAPYHESKAGKILTPRITNGYRRVTLSKEGNSKPYKLALLVAETFIGPRPKGWFINHRDGNKQNDKLANLEYVTPCYNACHAFEIGMRFKSPNFIAGQNHQNAKLSEESVRLILLSSEPNSILARRYRVSPSNIHSIRSRQSWIHVKA